MGGGPDVMGGGGQDGLGGGFQNNPLLFGPGGVPLRSDNSGGIG